LRTTAIEFKDHEGCGEHASIIECSRTIAYHSLTQGDMAPLAIIAEIERDNKNLSLKYSRIALQRHFKGLEKNPRYRRTTVSRS